LSERYAQEAIATAQSKQMEQLAIVGVITLGTTHFRKRDLAGAGRYLEQAIAMAHRNGATRQAALALASLASVHDQEEQSDNVLREAGEALDFFRTGNFVSESLFCYTLLGRAYRKKGDAASALNAFESASSLAQKANDRNGIAQAQSSLGSLLASQERFPEALTHYQTYADLAGTADDKGFAALQAGDLLWLLGRYDEAGTWLKRADEIGKKFPDLRLKAARAFAGMALSQGRNEEAERRTRAVLSTISRQDLALEAECRLTLGLALVRSGKLREGRTQCEAALNIMTKLGNVSGILAGRLGVLEAYVTAGDAVHARAAFAGIQAALEGRPESKWRAYALTGRMEPGQRAAAGQALYDVTNAWGAASAAYLARPDIHILASPLLSSDFAKH
jgi:tetratricopeptide (TPR) repeat protein